MREVEPGECILRLSGPRISYRDVVTMTNPDNALQIGEDRYVDLEKPGVLANHSCQPNAGVTPRLALVALRRIERDEEIRYDYSTTMDRDTECGFVCHCGASRCRKIIKGFATLPRRLKAQYQNYGVVQRFLLTEAG